MPGCWDLAEQEHDAVPAMPTPATAAVVAASTAAAVVSSLSMLNRPRPRGRLMAGHCPSCAVDDCKADLSKCRDYYLRHKVCQAHSKTPLAVVAGREMRFCQKCSRFHLLAEFDEDKRSCRKRLDGHNRRRRKPHVDSMDPWSFMTTQQGTMFSSFSAPRPEPSWSGIINSEHSNPYYTHQVLSNSRQNFTGSSSSSYSKEGWYFPFLAERDQMSFSAGATALEIPVRQHVVKAVTPPPPESSSSNKMLSDGQLTHVLNSDCALSLLSTQTQAISSSGDSSWMVCPSGQIPSVAQQHLVPNLQFSSSSWSACCQAVSGVSTTAGFSAIPSMDSKQLNNNALVLSSNDNEMNCHGIFHVGADGSSDGTSPYLQFSWH